MSRRHILITLGASAVSAAAASVVTALIAKKRYEALYDEMLAKELKASLDFFRETDPDLDSVTVDENPDTPLIDAEQIAEEADVEVEEVEDAPDEPEEDGLMRVFGSASEKPSLEELAARNQKTAYHKVLTDEEYVETDELPVEEEPYEDPDIVVISRDIFMENLSEFQQEAMTYFADGGVLDENNELVVDHEQYIGKGPYRFGDMSEDPQVVYIRNKKIEKEYEVVRDDGNAADFLAHSLQDMYSRHVT